MVHMMDMREKEDEEKQEEQTPLANLLDAGAVFGRGIGNREATGSTISTAGESAKGTTREATQGYSQQRRRGAV